VPADVSETTVSLDYNDVRVAARKALVQLLEPLVGFVLDSGLSTQELRWILREAAVRSVAAKQLDAERRINISGIAASTGIPRAEISRILRSSTRATPPLINRQQQSTNRILAVWHENPKFTTLEGKPADLKIYGRGVTFDSLVRSHGRGIPTRAMLDELTRVGAAEVLASRLVRAKTSVAVDRGMNVRAVRAFGERSSELLSTMLQNMRDPENPKFVASISRASVSSKVMPLLRKELASKGADFLADLQDSLPRDGANTLKTTQHSPSTRVSVTVFYHETDRKNPPRKDLRKKRENLRRER
jgi:hypothetical protein